MKRKSKLSLFGLVAIALATVFVVQNSTPVVVLRWFGLRSMALPLGVWVVLAALAGVLTAMLLAWLFRPSRGWKGGSSDVPPSDVFSEKGKNRSVAPQASRNWVDLEPDETEEMEAGTETVAYEPMSAASHRPAFARLPEDPQDFEPEYEPEAEVWDDENWEAQEYPGQYREYQEYAEEETGSPQDFGDRTYEVQQRPVESYREGTLYSYSYEKQEVPPPREVVSDADDASRAEILSEEPVSQDRETLEAFAEGPFVSSPAREDEGLEEESVAADWEDEAEWNDEGVEADLDETPRIPRERDRRQKRDAPLDDWTQPNRDDDLDW